MKILLLDNAWCVYDRDRFICSFRTKAEAVGCIRHMNRHKA